MFKLFSNSTAARLAQAIERDDADALAKVLRKASPVLLSQPVNNGLLATELAIDAQRPELLRLLLNAGCDANARNTENLPLSWRALSTQGAGGKSLELLGTLLRAGADPNSCNTAGTPLLHACFEFCEPARLMLHLSRLLEAGAHINSTDERGQSVLLLALRSERRELIQFLIHSNATIPEPLGADIDGDIALYAQRCRQDYQIRQQFLGA